MKELTLITLGLLAGWLIEWVIDWLYWRRRYRACQEENARLQDRLARLEGAAKGKKKSKGKPVEQGKPDDLTLIHGIGPVIAQQLNEAGITTFETLAGTTPAELRRLLGDLVERLADEEDLLSQAREFANEKDLVREARRRRKREQKAGKSDRKQKKKARKERESGTGEGTAESAEESGKGERPG